MATCHSEKGGFTVFPFDDTRANIMPSTHTFLDIKEKKCMHKRNYKAKYILKVHVWCG